MNFLCTIITGMNSLCVILGVNMPSSNFFCLYCDVEKKDRCDFTGMLLLRYQTSHWSALNSNLFFKQSCFFDYQLENDVGKWKINRSVAERASLFQKGREENKGYVNQGLIHVEFTKCPLDFLHLCKGVIGKQFNQVSLKILIKKCLHYLASEVFHIY